MPDVIVIAAARSRAVDVLLVAGYALAVPALARAVRARRTRARPIAAAGAAGANVVTLPERPPMRGGPSAEEAPARDDPREEAPPRPPSGLRARGTRGAVVAPVPAAPEPLPAPVAEELPEPDDAGLLDDELEEDEEQIRAADVHECAIAVWHGFRKSSFYAAPVLDDGALALALYTSPLFKSGSGEPERTEVALSAHNELLEVLAREGWVLVGAGQAWYSGRFRRDAPPED